MAGNPLSFDDLDELVLPIVASDRLVVGRGNDLKRLDFKYWRGGLSDRRIVTRPQSSDFGTWINQDGATLTDLEDGIAIEHGNSKTGDSLMARVRAIPGGSWDVRLGTIRGWRNHRYFIGGLYLRESSTGKIMAWGYAHDQSGGMFVTRWDGNTSFNSILKAVPETSQKSWWRAAKNATSIDFFYSVDGAVWDYFYTQAISGPFITAPDQWGFFINPVNQVTPHLPMRMDVFDWGE